MRWMVLGIALGAPPFYPAEWVEMTHLPRIGEAPSHSSP